MPHARGGQGDVVDRILVSQQRIVPTLRQYRLGTENVIPVVEPENAGTQSGQKQYFTHPATGRTAGSPQRLHYPDDARRDSESDQGSPKENHTHDKTGPQQAVMNQLRLVGNDLIAKIEE